MASNTRNRDQLKALCKYGGTLIGSILILALSAGIIYCLILCWTPIHNRLFISEDNPSADFGSVILTILIASASEFATWCGLIIEGCIAWSVMCIFGLLFLKIDNNDWLVDDMGKISCSIYNYTSALTYVLAGLFCGTGPKYFIWADLYGWYAIVTYCGMIPVLLVHICIVLVLLVLFWFVKMLWYSFRVLFGIIGKNDPEDPNTIIARATETVLKAEDVKPEDLECNICKDNIKNHVLECGHMVCSECLDGLIEKSGAKCSICRKKIKRNNVRKCYFN
jgi:hypothetical protein